MEDAKKKKKRKRNRSCQWFVASRHDNAHTNEVIAARLSGRTDIPRESVKCSDGRFRNLWPCTHEDVLAFEHSRGTAQIDFETLRQFDDESCPRIAPRFLSQSHNKKAAQRALRRLPRSAERSAASSS